MKNNLLLITIGVVISFFSCSNKTESKEQKLVAINPLAYTNVVYSSQRDTVIVATYSGRISKRIKNHTKEELITNVNDEVYSLQYSKSKKLIFASTLNSGILLIDYVNGEILKTLEVDKGAWLNTIHLSTDENYLVGFDTKGNNYAWDLNNNYKLIDISNELPKAYVRYVDSQGNFYFQQHRKYIKWNQEQGKIVKELNITGRLVDIDKENNLLFLGFNQFKKYNSDVDSIFLEKKHPYYLYRYGKKATDTSRIKMSLKLTDACWSEDKIFTTGIDKSIRVWNKKSGELLNEWNNTHNATISSIDLSKDNNQLVSVDLKGGIHFWSID
ncbi:MAG: hypothetical protein HWD85_07945 [Flavobacteriaceae bacterium]|nr:hypothetical protein [Flavobacteriaceae bacterium]